MNFTFTRQFILLLAAGFVLLLLAWVSRPIAYGALVFDIGLIALAVIDNLRSENRDAFRVEREMEDRFSMGAANSVTIKITNRSSRPIKFQVKDEYPPQMELLSPREAHLTIQPNRARSFGYELFPTARGDYAFGNTAVRFQSRLGLVWRQLSFETARTVRVYPNIRQAKENELYAHRNRDLKEGHRRMRLKGQGREFESLRDFVIGDEIRHISWPASARRGKLITRQYTVERNQNIVVMLDAGRLMTARIGQLSKLDHAINATLSIAYVAAAGGDNVGLLVFSRKVISYSPPKRGRDQINRVMEALYNVEPQMIEPSYGRAFSFLGANCHRRSLIVILTDLVDRDASAELLTHTSRLVPRHLPLIVTIADTDLRALARSFPATSADVYRQSVAEEILRQREEALSRIHQLGGLALDVSAGRLSFELVNKYLDVKERGLL
ncbi:MAG TPA: DUF58 domain-containing protein [Blastocatellia bacterium]|nr:DUF58 domain-containing protein [Blastocatellia bacterium]